MSNEEQLKMDRSTLGSFWSSNTVVWVAGVVLLLLGGPIAWHSAFSLPASWCGFLTSFFYFGGWLSLSHVTATRVCDVDSGEPGKELPSRLPPSLPANMHARCCSWQCWQQCNTLFSFRRPPSLSSTTFPFCIFPPPSPSTWLRLEREWIFAFSWHHLSPTTP